MDVWGIRQGMAAALAANRARWPCAVPVALGIGIGLYFALPEEPSWIAGPAVLLGLAVLAAVLRTRPAAFMAALFLALAALGFSAASLRTQDVEGGLLARQVVAATVEGRVVDLEPYPKGSRVVLDHLRIAGLAAPETPARVRLRLRADRPHLAAGQWVRLRASLSPPSPPVLPGGFDFQRHAFFQGLGAVGFALGAPEVLAAPPPGPLEWRIHLANLRLQLTRRVMAQIPGDAGAVAAALITGHRTVIGETTLDAFRDAGLAHLLAISGLHVGLAAGIVFVGLRLLLNLWPPLALRLPAKKLAAAGALAAAFLYALLAGATVPTQRAFLIVAMVLAAVMVDRRGISLRMLAWGAVVVLLVQPESLLGPSFQMSFAAAVALVSAYEWTSERGLWRRSGHDGLGRRLALYAAGVAFTTLVASLATAPFVLYHFNQVARYGLIANMVAVPVTALWVMPAAMLSFLLMPFGLEGLALAPMGWGTDLVDRVAARVAGLPDATQLLPTPPAWALGAAAVGGLWFCVVRGRALRVAGLGGVLAGALSFALLSPPDLVLSGDGKLAAVRLSGGGYALSDLRHGKFEREGWLSQAGYRPDQVEKWRRDGRDADGLRCDDQGCLLVRAGRTVAISETAAAVAEDCWQADLVVALVPARRLCPRPGRVVDFFDLWRHGAHSIRLTPKGAVIEAADADRGHRPWVLVPGAKNRD